MIPGLNWFLKAVVRCILSERDDTVTIIRAQSNQEKMTQDDASVNATTVNIFSPTRAGVRALEGGSGARG